jgi:exonuclease SbcD
MRILHLADFHLGKRLLSHSRQEEQEAVMAEIITIADDQKVDAVFIAGDLFDTFSPANWAVELFYKTLKKLAKDGKRPVVAIAGNHDSPDRVEVPEPLARECGIILIGHPQTEVPLFELEDAFSVTKSEPGFVELKLDRFDYPLRILTTPYANEQRLRTYFGEGDREEELRIVLASNWQNLADKYCDNKGVNTMMAHLYFGQRGAPLEPESDDEKPILHVGGAQVIYTDLLPKQLQYVACGHLHRRHSTSKKPCPVVYSGSPLGYSFNEENQEKYAVIVDLQPDTEVQYNMVKLESGRKLLRKRCEGVEEALTFLESTPDAWIELTLVTDTYITAQDRKRLKNAHVGLLPIIPEVKGIIDGEGAVPRNIDPTKDLEALFIEYFQEKNQGQAPNEELISLFREVRAVNA